jgi:hypothetical protein
MGGRGEAEGVGVIEGITLTDGDGSGVGELSRVGLGKIEGEGEAL